YPCAIAPSQEATRTTSDGPSGGAVARPPAMSSSGHDGSYTPTTTNEPQPVPSVVAFARPPAMSSSGHDGSYSPTTTNVPQPTPAVLPPLPPPRSATPTLAHIRPPPRTYRNLSPPAARFRVHQS